LVEERERVEALAAIFVPFNSIWIAEKEKKRKD
jgi:hypothetical protein